METRHSGVGSHGWEAEGVAPLDLKRAVCALHLRRHVLERRDSTRRIGEPTRRVEWPTIVERDGEATNTGARRAGGRGPVQEDQRADAVGVRPAIPALEHRRRRLCTGAAVRASRGDEVVDELVRQLAARVELAGLHILLQQWGRTLSERSAVAEKNNAW